LLIFLVLQVEEITYQKRLTGKNLLKLRLLIGRQQKSSPDKSEELSIF